jgi:NADPH:quinone reductase-like Zn-dependent oxidoreductase
MKAMVLDEIAPIETSPLKLRDVSDPLPGPGEVRLRVRRCAVCCEAGQARAASSIARATASDWTAAATS